MRIKKALITGISGQDGSFLAELLLSKGYEVHGIIRREALEDSNNRLNNIESVIEKIQLHVGAIENHLSVYKIIAEIMPQEFYHLASSSFVSYNFEDEVSLLENNFLATHALLASIKDLVPDCRVYFAGSSEMFGDARLSPQNEETSFNPRSVYGISKLAAFHLARNYREHHQLFVSAGILYNHESIRRGYKFVTRKISHTVAKIYLGLTDYIELGNINAQRDWGYAPDYVNAMYLMLQQETPKDFVIATGKLHTVKDFLQKAFEVVDLDFNKYLRINNAYVRPSEVMPLCGDASKAKTELGWSPTKEVEDIVKEMVLNDIKLLS
jgi:GDPmannose 4,6-dehydratase